MPGPFAALASQFCCEPGFVIIVMWELFSSEGFIAPHFHALCLHLITSIKMTSMWKRLHNHRGQGDGPVVIEFSDPSFVGDGDDGGGLEAGWNMPCLQGGFEDVYEHRRKLISTIQSGRGDSPGRLLFGGSAFWKACWRLSRIERVIATDGEVLEWVVQRHEPLSGWEGGWGWWSAAGWWGCGGWRQDCPIFFQIYSRTRSAPLPGEVIHGVGGFGLVVGDLSEPSADRSKVTCWELML